MTVATLLEHLVEGPLEHRWIFRHFGDMHCRQGRHVSPSSVHRVRSMPIVTPSCPQCVCVLVSDVIYVTFSWVHSWRPLATDLSLRLCLRYFRNLSCWCQWERSRHVATCCRWSFKDIPHARGNVSLLRLHLRCGGRPIVLPNLVRATRIASCSPIVSYFS